VIEQNETTDPVRQIREQAAEWAIKRADKPDWTDVDQAELDTWLSSSPSHMVAFLRVESAWQRVDRLRALRRPQAPQRKPTRLLKLAGVASVAVAVAVVALQGRLNPQFSVYSTPVGGHEVLKLADGSQIELNTATKLRTSLKGETRTVWLDAGEAYFQVRHDAGRPFIVYAAGHRLTDLGTKFLVRSAKERVQVTLIDGEVRFESSGVGVRGHSALMTAGDVVVATADSMSVTHHAVTKLENELGWRRGLLVFKHTTLKDAVEQFNRYNGDKISIEDPKVAQLTVDGTFRTTSTRHFAEVVQAVFGLQVRHQDRTTIISR